ncbi:hypothetical protein [Microbacterium panaciterrae]|uniref:Uncharacterized protein n=1 Tax=Microbacterium panaciterrae TaxID=985759 RepID=A0ABP8PPH4_9MICO
MTIAAGSEQQTPAGAERPTQGTLPGGLTLLPDLDGSDVGVCIDGVCRLPGQRA